MAYNETSLTTLKQLKSLAQIVKAAQDVLDTRMNAQVTASTESDADYAAEVVDARVDIWANENANLGKNIRNSQARLSKGLQLVQESHQEQLNELAAARIDNLVAATEAHKRRKAEIFTEEEIRINGDESLQEQINSLSDAVLYITLRLAEVG